VRRAEPGGAPHHREPQLASGRQDHPGQRPRSVLLAVREARMIKLIVRALALLVPVSLLVAPVTQASSQASLAEVRQATAKFHYVGAADHAGYHRLLPCFDPPGTGGTGQHYVNLHLPHAPAPPAAPEPEAYEVAA